MNKRTIAAVSTDAPRTVFVFRRVVASKTSTTSLRSNKSWTNYLSRCHLSCGRLFRIGRAELDQALEYARTDWLQHGRYRGEPVPTEAAIANTCFDTCLSCATGDFHHDEYAITDAAIEYMNSVSRTAESMVKAILRSLTHDTEL